MMSKKAMLLSALLALSLMLLGEIVGLLMTNRPEYLVAWLGLTSGTSVGRVVERWLTAAASPATRRNRTSARST